eukprot:4452536-Prymnesium_polylepis.1
MQPSRTPAPCRAHIPTCAPPTRFATRRRLRQTRPKHSDPASPCPCDFRSEHATSLAAVYRGCPARQLKTHPEPARQLKTHPELRG